MGFIAAKCPNCSANIRMEESQDSCYCPYCGSLIERERINISVSGSVKLDQSGQRKNYERLAESALAAANYAEAYSYYTKILEIAIDDPRAVFGKGLCAGYMSLTGAFRIIEVLEGYTAAMGLLGGDNDAKSHFTNEFTALARSYRAQYYGKGGCIFNDGAAFSSFCRTYQNMIRQLYDMSSRVPAVLSEQREAFLSLVLGACSEASENYFYYSFVKNSSGSTTRMKNVRKMPKNVRELAKTISGRCRADYYALPHIRQQTGRLDAEIAHNRENVVAFENALQDFSEANPLYVKKRRGITVGGTLIVILITAAACFFITGLGALVSPYFLIAIPAAIVAACLIWKNMKATKLAALDTGFLPPEIMALRETSIASGTAIAEAGKKKAALYLK